MVTADVRDRVMSEIEKMSDEISQSIQELVRIPSVVGQEGAAQRYMEAVYRSSDLEVETFEPDLERLKDHRSFIDTGMEYEGRPNVIGTLRGEADGRSIILNGHMDVVSPEPVGAWVHDPWGADIEGDRLYGRGSGDMKSGLVANLFALKGIMHAGIRPRGRVMLQSVIDEEAGGAGGTLACLEAGYTADALICTEPHNLNLTIAHAGINYFRVRVQGKTSHAGLAHLGINAIEKMYLVVQALIDLDKRRGEEVQFPLFEKGSGRSCHLNIGTMKAGDWPSTVAGSAEIECRVGYVPGEAMDEIKDLIEETIAGVAQRDPWLREHPPSVEWFGWQAHPWYQDPEHPFVQTLKNAAESVLDREVEFIGRAAGIDSRFSQDFGMAGACTGPVAGNLHGLDEYVELPSVTQVAKILALTVLDWCGCE